MPNWKLREAIRKVRTLDGRCTLQRATNHGLRGGVLRSQGIEQWESGAIMARRVGLSIFR